MQIVLCENPEIRQQKNNGKKNEKSWEYEAKNRDKVKKARIIAHTQQILPSNEGSMLPGTF